MSQRHPALTRLGLNLRQWRENNGFTQEKRDFPFLSQCRTLVDLVRVRGSREL